MEAAESTEKEDWARLTAEQFFQGYSDSDSIYDKLSCRRQSLDDVEE